MAEANFEKYVYESTKRKTNLLHDFHYRSEKFQGHVKDHLLPRLEKFHGKDLCISRAIASKIEVVWPEKE